MQEETDKATSACLQEISSIEDDFSDLQSLGEHGEGIVRFGSSKYKFKRASNHSIPYGISNYS